MICGAAGQQHSQCLDNHIVAERKHSLGHILQIFFSHIDAGRRRERRIKAAGTHAIILFVRYISVSMPKNTHGIN